MTTHTDEKAHKINRLSPFITLRLNALISRIVDARDGYQQASETVRDDDLKALFTYSSEQRDEFCSALEHAMEEWGAPSEEWRPLKHTLRSAVISLKEIFTDHPPHEVIDECLSFEGDAIGEYASLIDEKGIPAELGALLAEQRDRIVAEIEQLKRLHLEVESEN
ncbi:MAG: DUF2383 domain-containing protein [Verrucomicrobiae bacterium]|nr:DUF2383 domain-containing protein [Verrucomicrobiae bacterium]